MLQTRKSHMNDHINGALAAIDVGTNSIHMVIARPVAAAPAKVLARDRMPVRLGSGGADMKHLRSDAIDRAVKALVECRHVADAHRAEAVAVATSAVREAENREDFLRRAREEAGIEVEVVSGFEEARLIHLGAMSAVPIAQRPHLVIDIGGGSTELIVGDHTPATLTRSLKLGHIRLTERFFPNGVITPGSVKACRRHIRSSVAHVALQARSIGFDTVVGCSGTVAALAVMCAARRSVTLHNVANATISRKDLDAVTAELISRHRPEDRLGIPGLDPSRNDVIVAGAILLRQLLKALGIGSLVVSTGALREGLMLDRFNRRDQSRDDGLHHLSDLRRSSVLALASSHHEDIKHAEHATDLALELFEETATVHGLGTADSELLEAAGLLHNIGRFVAHASHHKHSYYLIRNSERLAGFTAAELELIALVARYHRKSEPLPSHSEYIALNKTDRYRVRVLAGLLKVGIALDRTYRRIVQRVHASVTEDSPTEDSPTDDSPTDDALRIDVEVAEGADAGIEVFSAQRSASLLARALELPVRFEVVTATTAQQRHRAHATAEDAVSVL